VTFAFLLLALVTSVNPCRLRLVLPELRAAVALGALIALGTGAAVAAIGDAFLDALDITPETFRLASAVVLALEGARALVLARPAREPELGGLGAAVVPVAFPLLLTPGVVMLALTAGGDDVVGWAVGALGVAYALVVLSTLIPRSTRVDALLAAGGRLLGAAEIAAGVALAVDSLHDV
jgi:small neutral amino acid transporter SnatA (MarC family)